MAERVGGDAEVLLDGEPGQQAPALGHDRDAGAADELGPLAREVGVAEQDAAAVDAEHAADGEHERRLAGAVRAEQRRDLARRDRQRDVVQDAAAAARDAEILEAELGPGGGVGGRHSTASPRVPSTSSVPR